MLIFWVCNDFYCQFQLRKHLCVTHPSLSAINIVCCLHKIAINETLIAVVRIVYLYYMEIVEFKCSKYFIKFFSFFCNIWTSYYLSNNKRQLGWRESGKYEITEWNMVQWCKLFYIISKFIQLADRLPDKPTTRDTLHMRFDYFNVFSQFLHLFVHIIFFPVHVLPFHF